MSSISVGFLILLLISVLGRRIRLLGIPPKSYRL